MFEPIADMRTVAVIGANGSIGSRIVEMMHLGAWANIRPVVRRPAALASASRFAIKGQIADASDEASLVSAFENCNSVIHAVAGDPTLIVNSIRPVYSAAEAAGVRRLVYISTASVHGQSPPAGTNEQSQLSDRQSIEYNNAKVRAERLLLRLRATGKVEIVILRPGIVYGPRTRWTGGLADDLLAGTAYLVDGGKGICNGIYVDNLVHAIRLAIEVPEADGNAYLVGDFETISWYDLCQPIASALGFDAADIAVEAPRDFRPHWLGRLSQSKILHHGLQRLPNPLSAGLRAGYAELRKRNQQSRRRQPSAVTEESALLHRCQTKLLSEKAERELGYRPLVKFDDACRRSVEWLKFAGYPLIEPT